MEEFNRELTGMFSDFTGEVTAATEETFRTAPITAGGADLAAASLAKRPSATWTYVVQDNPFGTDFGRAARAVSRMLGRR